MNTQQKIESRLQTDCIGFFLCLVKTINHLKNKKKFDIINIEDERRKNSKANLQKYKIKEPTPKQSVGQFKVCRQLMFLVGLPM